MRVAGLCTFAVVVLVQTVLILQPFTARLEVPGLPVTAPIARPVVKLHRSFWIHRMSTLSIVFALVETAG